MVPIPTPNELAAKFRGIWHCAQNKYTLDEVTPEVIESIAAEKGIPGIAKHMTVGVFNPIPAIVLEVQGCKGCFPLVSSHGDAEWRARKAARDHEALLWEKMEWFLPLWIPFGPTSELLNAVKDCSKERAIELFDYHTSTLYTLPFQAICIAQIMPKARSLTEIVPLAREAYLSQYSGYRASSIAALIPAIEGSLTRIVADIPPQTPTAGKIDHAINRAIQTAAALHFGEMWVPSEYKTFEYLFSQDERVFAFETFRRWLKNHFFCATDHYPGITWLNRHMFAHGTASSWQRGTNFQRLVVALATLAAIESWYDSSHRVSFLLPEMDEDGHLLWQQALFQAEAQMTLKLVEEQRYHRHGRLVPEMPTDNGVLLRTSLLSQACMDELVKPLREAGWSVRVDDPDPAALYITVHASDHEKTLRIALLYSCATDNAIYRMLAEDCHAILYRGAPYKEASYAYGIPVHVGPVLGWQPPKATT